MADLEALTREYLAAFDARDLEKCLSFFGDDATIDFQNVEYEGRESIGEWHQERFQANLRLNKIDNVRVKGNTVLVDAIASSDRLAAWKINSLKSRIEAKFVDGKIQEAKLTARITSVFSMIRAGE
jgi:ketosteroid isomerase-like protein